MNSDVENIWDPEDYRYAMHELNRQYQLGEIQDEEYAEKMKPLFEDAEVGAHCKYMQCMEEENPFAGLWGKALANMSRDDLEAGIRDISDKWSSFMDLVFAIWHLRQAEIALDKPMKPMEV